MGYKHIKWYDDWIKENYLLYPSYKALTKAYNQKFNTNAGVSAMKNHARIYLKLQKPRTDYVAYTEEQIEWLKSYYPTHSIADTTQAFNKKFNGNKTKSCIKNFGACYGVQVNPEFATKHKIEPCHSKGARKLRKLGDIRVECGRLVMKGPSGWDAVGRVIYKMHGKDIPKGYHVIHLDGDVSNYDISNLQAVPPKYAGLLSKYGMRSSDPEITKIGIIWCQLYDALGLKKGDLVDDSF